MTVLRQNPGRPIYYKNPYVKSSPEALKNCSTPKRNKQTTTNIIDIKAQNINHYKSKHLVCLLCTFQPIRKHPQLLPSTYTKQTENTHFKTEPPGLLPSTFLKRLYYENTHLFFINRTKCSKKPFKEKNTRKTNKNKRTNNNPPISTTA